MKHDSRNTQPRRVTCHNCGGSGEIERVVGRSEGKPVTARDICPVCRGPGALLA